MTAVPSSGPLWVLLSSLLAGIAIFVLREEQHRARTTINLAAAVAKLLVVAWLAREVVLGRRPETRLPFLPGAELLLRADAFSLLFVTLSAVLWLVTTVYAVGYLEDSPHRSRFFGFFSLSVAATMGVALAGNLLTFFVFYELLTVSTWPLVVHRGSPEALQAGARYLRYTLVGGTALLAATAGLYALAGPVEFAEGGALGRVEDADRDLLVALFGLAAAGLGVKAALFPLHAWLPSAMVAPAPVSALLHAVAVVKAGAFGLTRLVYHVYGIRLADALGVMGPLSVVAAVTILVGSVQALRQRGIKARLAWSTISQVSYVILGVAIVGTVSTVGGIVHLVHQGLMKVTLFYCAGNLAEELDVHDVQELAGTGRRMPVTLAAFTVGALGMVGLPPVAGFVSKWYLGAGALEANQSWGLWVLLASSLLNAAYFLPLLHDAWFLPPPTPWPSATRAPFETSPWLLLPPAVTAILSVAAGVLSGLSLSPLGWASRVAALEFGP